MIWSHLPSVTAWITAVQSSAGGQMRIYWNGKLQALEDVRHVTNNDTKIH